jgi:hypothetical protein
MLCFQSNKPIVTRDYPPAIEEGQSLAITVPPPRGKAIGSHHIRG